MIGRDPPRTSSTLATGLVYIEVQHLFCLRPLIDRRGVQRYEFSLYRYQVYLRGSPPSEVTLA